MTTPTTPNRTFTLTKDKTGWLVSWVDTWYCRFDRGVRSCTSQARGVGGWMGLGISHYEETVFDDTGRVVRTTPLSIDLWGNPGGESATVNAAGPGTLGLSASHPYFDSIQSKGGLKVDPNKSVQHRVVSTGLVDIAHDMKMWWADFSSPAFGNQNPDQPTKVTVPGDFRRPGWARTTAALSDDELFRVNLVASHHGVTGPELMAILLELTGARRTAYHPDGFYGIGNIQERVLEQRLKLGFPGLPAIRTVQDFMNASAQTQLTMTDAFLDLGLGGQRGVVPVFLFMATGGLPANAGPATVIPAPLPARLLPWSSDGTTLKGSDIAARISKLAGLLAPEFTARLPVAYHQLT